MTELIPIRPGYIGGKVTLVVNARDLHTFLQVGRGFSNWIRGRIDEYGFEENTDYATIDSSKLANRRGRGGGQRSKTTISPRNGERTGDGRAERERTAGSPLLRRLRAATAGDPDKPPECAHA